MGSLRAGGSPGPEDTVANNKRPCRKQGERCGPISGSLTATCVPAQKTAPPPTEGGRERGEKERERLRTICKDLISPSMLVVTSTGLECHAINENY